MRKAYLLAYADRLGTREEIKDFLNESPVVIHWRHDLPHTFYIISQSTAKELSLLIREWSEGKGRFFITEISETNRFGWLPSETWTLLKEKKRTKAVKKKNPS